MRWSALSMAPLLAAMALAGCSETYWTSNFHEVSWLPKDSVYVTNADLRLVYRFTGYEARLERDKAHPDDPSRNVIAYEPREYLCAEPSPDVAKVVQAAITASGSGAATVTPPAGGTKVDAQVAAQLAASRSEGLAQLTRRIATIQLLRDGLYRACEAYANGAINREIYSAIVSRYDRMMVTMLLAEMAAGNFGTVVTLTGQSAAGPTGDTAATAAQAVKDAQGAVTDAQSKLDAANTDVAQKTTANNTAQKNVSDAAKAGSSTTDLQTTADGTASDLKTSQAAQASAQANLDSANTQLKAAQAAQRAPAGNASSSTQASVAGAEAPQTQVADVLLKMQRAYLDEPPGASLVLMCMSQAFNPTPGSQSGAMCAQILNNLNDPRTRQVLYDTTARAQLRELDNERIEGLAKQLAGKTGQVPASVLQSRPETPTPFK